MLYIIGCLILIIGFLGFKLFQKQKIDTAALDKYKEEISEATKEWKNILLQKSVAERDLNDVIKTRSYNEHLSDEYLQKVKEAEERYNNLVDERMKELDQTIEKERTKRQTELDKTFYEKQAHYDTLLKETLQECGRQTEEALELTTNKLKEYDEANAFYEKKINDLKQQFESIEQTLRSYDEEQQAKLFYTIQLPEEYQEDIEFLLTTVAARVQHPDIISKLVWSEYVKPNLDDTFKRIEIKCEPGIYKLTSLINGKCYIGKSTNVKNRIADHFKSVVGIKSIADQAVHHAILKEGFWNWQIEIITYCDKDQLSELEKYYIEFFKSQDFGYNRNAGG